MVGEKIWEMYDPTGGSIDMTIERLKKAKENGYSVLGTIVILGDKGAATGFSVVDWKNNFIGVLAAAQINSDVLRQAVTKMHEEFMKQQRPK